MLSDTNAGSIAQPITNPDTPFYPGVDLAEFAELYRVQVAAAPVLCERQIILALVEVNARLAAWKAFQVLAGAAALPAASAEQYTEAVYATAMALLIPVLPSVVTDERAREDADGWRQRPRDFRRRADEMIARITGDRKGSGNVRAELI